MTSLHLGEPNGGSNRILSRVVMHHGKPTLSQRSGDGSKRRLRFTFNTCNACDCPTGFDLAVILSSCNVLEIIATLFFLVASLECSFTRTSGPRPVHGCTTTWIYAYINTRVEQANTTQSISILSTFWRSWYQFILIWLISKCSLIHTKFSYYMMLISYIVLILLW